MKAKRNSTRKKGKRGEPRKPENLGGPGLFAAYVKLLPEGDRGWQELVMTAVAIIGLLNQEAEKGSRVASHRLFGLFEIICSLVSAGSAKPRKFQLRKMSNRDRAVFIALTQGQKTKS